MRQWMLLAAIGLGSAVQAHGALAQDAFNLEETVAICASCHGEDGIPIEADYPIIWGQQYYYLYVQLKDYKAGRRANDIMEPIAAEFEKEQMQALAKYFSEKPWPDISTHRDAERAKKGQSQTVAGQCSQCHNTYMGDSRVPRVAGQQEEYLKRTMLEFKNKIRLNAAAKGSLMKSYDDPSIEDLAHYLATL